MLVRISLSLLALGAVQAAANNESVPGSSVLRGSRKLQTTCDNGFPGIGASNSAGDNVCCPLECNQCGGVGCGRNGDRGFGNKECCPNGIVANQGDCADTGSAPCVITDATTPAPTTPAPTTPVPMTPAPTTSAPSDAGSTCSNGIPGIGGTNDNGEVCCPIACNQCGGAGCAQSGAASGLSNKHCCINGVLNNQGNCGSAPCVITTDTPAPATAAPTTASPTTDSPTAPSPTPTTPTPSGNVDSYLITPPTPVMTIPDDPSECSGGLPEFRYASSSGKVGKGRLYAEGAGCFTMSDIYKWRGFQSSGGVLSPKGPIYELDANNDPVATVTSTDPTVTNKWLLEAELYITDGAIFYCKGVEAGGDCDALRIRSTGPNDFYEVRGYGGSLYFEDTVVTSWDTTTQKPQEVHEEGRSYLNCVSEYLTGETCEGQAKNDMGECRMDLINTEAAYLGYLASESYGLTWKVRGFCKDLSNHDVFTSTNVYGNIIGSDIHHNYYGHYSYGHQGGVWTNNKMHHNHQYGFDPHDDSDYLTIANNEVYENVNHGIIASKRCNHVEIYGNTVYSGGAQAAGIFLHRSSDEAEVYNNIIYDMQDAGIAFLESMNAKVYNNDIKTTKFGIRLSLGSAGNHIYSNIFDDASDWGLYTYQGSDDPTSGVSDGRPAYNVFENNVVTGTAGGVKFKNSDNLSVIGNMFTDTEELEFYNAQNILWSGNSLPSSGVCLDNIDSDDGSSIPTSTFTGSSGLPPEC